MVAVVVAVVTSWKPLIGSRTEGQRRGHGRQWTERRKIRSKEEDNSNKVLPKHSKLNCCYYFFRYLFFIVSCHFG